MKNNFSERVKKYMPLNEEFEDQVEVFGKKYEIYKNPTINEIKKLKNPNDRYYLRFIIDEKNFYLFSGNLLHMHVIKEFNLPNTILKGIGNISIGNKLFINSINNEILDTYEIYDMLKKPKYSYLNKYINLKEYLEHIKKIKHKNELEIISKERKKINEKWEDQISTHGKFGPKFPVYSNPTGQELKKLVSGDIAKPYVRFFIIGSKIYVYPGNLLHGVAREFMNRQNTIGYKIDKYVIKGVGTVKNGKIQIELIDSLTFKEGMRKYFQDNYKQYKWMNKYSDFDEYLKSTYNIEINEMIIFKSSRGSKYHIYKNPTTEDLKQLQQNKDSQHINFIIDRNNIYAFSTKQKYYAAANFLKLKDRNYFRGMGDIINGKINILLIYNISHPKQNSYGIYKKIKSEEFEWLNKYTNLNDFIYKLRKEHKERRSLRKKEKELLADIKRKYKKEEWEDQVVIEKAKYDIYKNPSSVDLKKASLQGPYNGIRFLINEKDLYAFSSEVIHSTTIRKLKLNPFKVIKGYGKFRNGKIEINNIYGYGENFSNSESNPKETIKKLSDMLWLNKYTHLGDFLKKLKEQKSLNEEWKDQILFYNHKYNIYKNPTIKEFVKIKKEHEGHFSLLTDYLRFVIIHNNIYVFSSDLIHEAVIRKLAKNGIKSRNTIKGIGKQIGNKLKIKKLYFPEHLKIFERNPKEVLAELEKSKYHFLKKHLLYNEYIDKLKRYIKE